MKLATPDGAAVVSRHLYILVTYANRELRYLKPKSLVIFVEALWWWVTKCMELTFDFHKTSVTDDT